MGAAPLRLRKANEFFAKHQRHNLPAVGGKLAVGAAVALQLTCSSCPTLSLTNTN
jgi:hypothetical protein